MMLGIGPKSIESFAALEWIALAVAPNAVDIIAKDGGKLAEIGFHIAVEIRRKQKPRPIGIVGNLASLVVVEVVVRKQDEPAREMDRGDLTDRCRQFCLDTPLHAEKLIVEPLLIAARFARHRPLSNRGEERYFRNTPDRLRFHQLRHGS